MSTNWFRDDIGSRLAESTAVLAAIASTGRTFGRGLMPRTTAGQALATGLTGSVNYGMLATSQSILWAGASMAAVKLMPDELPEGVDPLHAYRGRVRAVAYGTYAVTALSARPLQRLVPQRPGESVARGVARSYLQRLEVVSVAGAISTGILDTTVTLLDEMPRSRRRPVVTGLIAVTGTAIAITQVNRERRRRARAEGAPPPLNRTAVAAGAATALGLTALGRTEGMAAGLIARAMEQAVPAPVGRAAGHAVLLAGLGVGVWQGVEYLYRHIEEAGSATETLHTQRPTGLHVSGGPASSVDWTTMSREGRRFAGLALTGAEIETVMGPPVAEPVRVFVPLLNDQNPTDRARIALAEMDALGAFDRPVIALCSPTGTGYINYVMMEAMEYLSRGNCATVAVQYSLRPSFLSLDRVELGRANATALLAAVSDRVATMPADRRPRLVLFGESLGAHTAQDVALHRGTAGFTQFGIDRALFIGTPDESGWAKQWRADRAGTDPDGAVVEVDNYEDFELLSDDARAAARIVLVSHHEDPITKFGPELIIRRPDWLDPDRSARPPGIPAEIDWRPLATFFVTVADVINSMTVVPGQFGADGHDYREDLARFTSAAYGLPCSPEELARIEAALRARELRIAEARLVADTINSARAGVRDKLAGWGVTGADTEHLIETETRRLRAVPEA